MAGIGSSNGGGGGSMKMFVLLPMMLFMGKVDFENTTILLYARMTFALMQVMQGLLAFYARRKIEHEKDERIIHVPEPMTPFNNTATAGTPRKYTQTTYLAHETGKAKEFMQQCMIGALISSFLHFQFGVKQVVLIQSVMIPMNLYENVLIRTVLFGRGSKRIWDEKLDGESLTAASDAKSTKLSSGLKKSLPEDPKAAIIHTWDEAANGDFEALWNRISDEPNVATGTDQWTALMIACGSPVDTSAFLKKMLHSERLNVSQQDVDGWTALHWAAFHGRPQAAKLLLSNVSDSVGKTLIDCKDNQGKTALDIATEEDSVDVISVLNETQWSVIESSDVPSDGLRQRKQPQEMNNVD